MNVMAKLSHYYQPGSHERIEGVEPPERCEWRGGLYNEIDCRYPFRPELHADRCPVVIEYTEDDGYPNRWECDEVVTKRFPHCNDCQNHHTPEADCQTVADMMEADDQMMRYAR